MARALPAMLWVAAFVAVAIEAAAAMAAEPATAGAGPAATGGTGRQRLRPPAVPLVTHDPYFSIWSCADELASDWPRHWTGAVHALCSMVRVDGKPYRLMGVQPTEVPAARQVSLRVLPTRTVYEFEAGGVELTLTFTSPLLCDDLDVMARPVTYVAWSARCGDGKPHEAAVYLDCTGELVVDKPEQTITWSRPLASGLVILRMGSQDQPVLVRDGDNLRIDWGWLYLAAVEGQRPRMVVAPAEAARGGFASGEGLPRKDDEGKPRAAKDRWPVCAATIDLGKVGEQAVSAWLMLAYDDEYSIQYLGTNLRPWWRRGELDAFGLLQKAAKDYPALVRRCEAFDAELMADMERVGGPNYADLCALAYREALAAHKLTAGPDGAPLLFSKECFSNGCIATVDVAYPAAPIFMLLSNELLKASIEPVLRYAAMDRWRFDFAPHDLGRYPKANGQRYGGGEKTADRQMPVEESGNLLIMTAVIARIDGHADYARRHWGVLSKWAAYLKDKGLDPENQLCTDDFAGHLAHNVNLSAKAIVALACYAELAKLAGKLDEAAGYRRTAEDFARRWATMADDGDHYRLAFDKPGTWSQKYNLVWDRILGLKLFDERIAAKEVAYYKTKLNRFGLPLDNRETYTKTDWEVWTATLAASREDFDALMKPVYAFVSATEPRVPLTDWYWTLDARKRGFQARPVIGGVFIKALADAEPWAKYAGRRRGAGGCGG